MSYSRVAKRYAKSLLGLAIEQNKLEEIYADMKGIDALCEENKDFRLLLQSPIVKTDKKQAILKQVFEGKLTEISGQFISILTSKRREMVLPAIAEEFMFQYKAHKNITTAEVTTAIAMDEALRARVMGLFKEQGDAIDLVEKVDADIIGGMVVKVGDKQVDASIQRRIQDLKRNLNDNSYINKMN